LDSKVGRDRYVLAFTADHGMPPEPDTRLGRRRVYTDEIVKLIHDRFDPEKGGLVRHYEPENAQLAIDRNRLRELGLDLEALRKLLEAQPFIFSAYTEDELATASAALP
jgi:DNA-binding transcriptional MerR regulator